HRFRVVLPAFGQRLLVIPDLSRWAYLLEEEKVGCDGGVRRKYSIGEADDRVQIEAFQEILLDPCRHSIPEKDAIGDDHAAAASSLQTPHDELEKEEGGFGGAR